MSEGRMLIAGAGVGGLALGCALAQSGIEPVVFELADGTERGAALVGADGLRSVVRERLRGAEPLRYAGYTAWRGVCPLPAGGLGNRGVEVWGPGMRFGYTPMGEGEVYWFATANAPAGGADGARPREELLERFAGWAEPVATLIAATPEEAILRTDILDRKPTGAWSQGRVTLLGDAAHPMTPNMGQGACQAIEDAVVLAECLAETRGPAAAFARYEARRQARTRWFVDRSRAIGAVGQWEHGGLRAIRDAGIRLTPPGAIVGQLRAMVAGSGLA